MRPQIAELAAAYKPATTDPVELEEHHGCYKRLRDLEKWSEIGVDFAANRELRLSAPSLDESRSRLRGVIEKCDLPDEVLCQLKAIRAKADDLWNQANHLKSDGCINLLLLEKRWQLFSGGSTDLEEMLAAIDAITHWVAEQQSRPAPALPPPEGAAGSLTPNPATLSSGIRDPILRLLSEPEAHGEAAPSGNHVPPPEDWVGETASAVAQTVGVTVNSRMLDTYQKRPESLKWSVRDWQQHLAVGDRKPSTSTIHDTPAWHMLRKLREEQAEELKEKQGAKDQTGKRRPRL